MTSTDPQLIVGVWFAGVSVLLPLVLGLGALVRPLRRLAVALAPVAALPALVTALSGRADWVVDLPWLLVGARVGLDLTGRVYLLLGAVTFTLAAVAARFDAVVERGGASRFLAFFLLSAAGTFGLAFAEDAVTFYVSFALMSFPAYGLVVFDRQPASVRAGRAYIAFVVVGEVLLVSGLFIAVWAAGGTNLELLPERIFRSRTALVSVPLILVAFAMKAGAVPLHVWLPPSYSQAPTPASAALAGAMSKAGVLGWLRFLPLGEISLPFWGLVMLAAGLLAAFYGVVVGLTQRAPKPALAYSSVSQMGFITSAVGLGLLAPSAWPVLLVAVLVYLLHHGLAKGALFLGTGLAGDIGRGRSRKAAVVLLVGLGLCGLALAGAPLTSGALAKVLIKGGFAATGMPSAASVITLLSLAAVGTTLLIARFLALVWNEIREPRPNDGEHPKAVSGAAIVPWAAATCLSLLSPWLFLGGLTDPAGVLTLATTWPVAAGILVSVVALAAVNRGWHPRLPDIPEGDLLAVYERVASGTVAAGRAIGRACGRLTMTISGGVSAQTGAESATRAVSRAESRLAPWRPFGLLFVALLVVVLTFLTLGSP